MCHVDDGVVGSFGVVVGVVAVDGDVTDSVVDVVDVVSVVAVDGDVADAVGVFVGVVAVRDDVVDVVGVVAGVAAAGDDFVDVVGVVVVDGDVVVAVEVRLFFIVIQSSSTLSTSPLSSNL